MDIEAILSYGAAALFVGVIIYKMFFNKDDSSKLGGRPGNDGSNDKQK